MEAEMFCPFLRECLQELANRRHIFDKDRCTHKERWEKCPVRKVLEGMLDQS
jgi:hypothetical protein